MGGGGGPSSTGSSVSSLYNWKKILPPWVQAGQQQVLPWLMGQAQMGGMLPSESKALWGQAKSNIEQSSMDAGKNFGRQMATSGFSPGSPAVAGGYADLASDKIAATSKAAIDFAKLKMGARDTAIGQMLTALYTPPPVAVGSTSTQQSSGGGGK